MTFDSSTFTVPDGFREVSREEFYLAVDGASASDPMPFTDRPSGPTEWRCQRAGNRVFGLTWEGYTFSDGKARYAVKV